MTVGLTCFKISSFNNFLYSRRTKNMGLLVFLNVLCPKVCFWCRNRVSWCLISSRSFVWVDSDFHNGRILSKLVCLDGWITEPQFRPSSSKLHVDQALRTWTSGASVLMSKHLRKSMRTRDGSQVWRRMWLCGNNDFEIQSKQRCFGGASKKYALNLPIGVL